MGKEDLEAPTNKTSEPESGKKSAPKEKRFTGKLFLEGDRKILTDLGVRIILATSDKIAQDKKVEMHSSFLSTQQYENTPVTNQQLGFFAEKPRFYMPETAGLNLFQQQMIIYDFARKLSGRLKAVALHMPSIYEMLQIAHDEIGSGLLVDPLGRQVRTTTRADGNTLYLGRGEFNNSGVLNLNLLSWEADRGSSKLYTTPIFVPR